MHLFILELPIAGEIKTESYMNRKKIIANIAALLLPILVFAQDAAKPAEKTVESGNNLLAILLSVVAILLTLVIWGMGRALVEVSRMVLEKNKKVAGAAANLPLDSDPRR